MDSEHDHLNTSQNQIQQQDNQNEQDDENTNNINANTKTKAKLQEKNKLLLRQFNKAKRTVTKMVAQYFGNLKNQLLNNDGTGRFIYRQDHIKSVEAALAKIATIRYTDLSTLVPRKSQIVDDFLLSYLGQSKKIIKYNLNIHNNNTQKPKQVQLYSQENLQLPDNATPAAFGGNAYFFDGSKFDTQRFVYVPVPANYKINLITGQVTLIENKPQFYRMKCCIIKVKRGFFIIGGYAGQNKVVTKRCCFFSVQSNSFHSISSLNHIHSCPSGCVHNDKIYVFSDTGIQYFQQNQNVWVSIELPKRLHNLSFQYCISVSASQIMMIGGKICNQNSSDIRIYNSQTQKIDQYCDVLSVGVSNQRSWGPMIVNNYITIMSNIQASILPQVTIKRDAVQLVFIGFGGCFLNTLLSS